MHANIDLGDSANRTPLLPLLAPSSVLFPMAGSF